MFIVILKHAHELPAAISVYGSQAETEAICRKLVANAGVESISLLDDTPALIGQWQHTTNGKPLRRSPVRAPVRPEKTPDDPPLTTPAPASSEQFNGYCVKCKAKRDFDGEIHTTANGRRMAQGRCPVCDTKMNRILPSVKAA